MKRGLGGLFGSLLLFVPLLGRADPSFWASEQFRWGVIAFQNGFFEKAILSLSTALTEDPLNAQFHFWLGRSYYRAGYQQAALEEWKPLVDQGSGGAALAHFYKIVKASRRLQQIPPPEIQQWIHTGSIEKRQDGDPFFLHPTTVRSTREGDGSYYIVAFERGEILHFGATGNLKRRLNGGVRGYDRPFDLAPLPDGSFLLSEYGENRVTLSDKKGKRIRTFGSRGSGKGELLGPQFLALSGEKSFYVTDWGNRRVIKFDINTGQPLLTLGEYSDRFPGFSGPSGIAVQNGQVLVADQLTKRVEWFDESGNYLGFLPIEGLNNPEGLLWRDSLLYLADGTRVILYDLPTKTTRSLFSSSLQHSISLDMDENNQLLVSDYEKGRVIILSEASSLYGGLFLRIDRIDGERFPEILLDFTVEDRQGNPIVGLEEKDITVTEGAKAVDDLSLVFAGYFSKTLRSAFIFEESVKMRPFKEKLAQAFSQLKDQLGPEDSWKIVSAGKTPMVHNAKGWRPSEISDWPDSWDPESAIRLAASQLITERARRHLFFVTQGELPPKGFDRYGVVPLSRYMANNNISFHVIYVDGLKEGNPDLDYLSLETKGEIFFLDQPTGLFNLVAQAKKKKSGSYTVSFQSKSQGDFGHALIPVELVVTFGRKSSRDELGYFAFPQ